MVNLLMSLIGLLLMVGQIQVAQGLSCDPNTLTFSKSPDVYVGQNKSLMRDGDVYETDLVNQLEPKSVVECRMKDATSITLTCDSVSVTKNESYVVERFPLKNGTRCVCSAQHPTLCFRDVTFTAQPKNSLSFAANGSKIQFNVYAGQAVHLECTVDNNINYNMTILDKYNSTLATTKKTQRIETTVKAPAQPVAMYFCSASSGDVTLIQSIQLNIKPLISFTATNKEGKKDIHSGDDVHFNCEIKGYPSSEITIKDMRTGKTLTPGFKDEFRATAKEVFGCDTQHNSRLFECIVNNNVLQGPVKSTLELTVHCMSGGSRFFNPVFLVFFTIAVILAGFW